MSGPQLIIPLQRLPRLPGRTAESLADLPMPLGDGVSYFGLASSGSCIRPFRGWRRDKQPIALGVTFRPEEY